MKFLFYLWSQFDQKNILACKQIISSRIRVLYKRWRHWLLLEISTRSYFRSMTNSRKVLSTCKMGNLKWEGPLYQLNWWRREITVWVLDDRGIVSASHLKAPEWGGVPPTVVLSQWEREERHKARWSNHSNHGSAGEWPLIRNRYELIKR